MQTVIWNLPTVILHNVTIMPGSSTQIDMVNKESCYAVTKAMQGDGRIFLLTVKKEEAKDTPFETYNMGTIAKVKQFVKLPDKTLRVLLDVEKRGKLVAIVREERCYMSDASPVEYEPIDESDMEAATYVRMLKDKLKEVFALGIGNNKLLFRQIIGISDLNLLTDSIGEFMNFPYENKQKLLEILDARERAVYLLKNLEEEKNIAEIRNDIQEKLKSCVNKHQKEYVLREQLKLIKQELGEDDTDIIQNLEERIDKLLAPDEVIDKLKKEIQRLKITPAASGENGIITNYIETLLDYPWEVSGKENLNLKKAIKILENDHYGLCEVKERIIDYLAVRILNRQGDMPIICLVGPPGTGKTSIAKSIAKATGREYVRMSLGGVRDEAEIRGHRKTYIGAMPGRIAASISKAGTNNPLMLFDEIDKVSSDYKGDVASALLEVLDGEQNSHFQDHYFEVPIDLSNVLFIATANDTSTIPGPLLDRMEVIEVSGYTETEKFHIAKLYLVDKARKKNGLTKSNFKINDEAIRYIIRYYTKEAGVRTLERTIDKLCRKACRILLTEDCDCVKITRRNLVEILGTEKYQDEDKNLSDKTGAVRGLAWTSVGGVTLDIEANIMPGSGSIQLTGKLGDVMKESAMAGLSYIRSMEEAKTLEEDFFENHDIHIHIPEGAVPKDGPSAGITMTTALYSAIYNQPVKGNLAMTGEVTIRGQVLPIGGLKEKLLAAKSLGITTVIVPEKNQRDVEDIDEEITSGLNLIYVKNMQQVLEAALVNGFRTLEEK